MRGHWELLRIIHRMDIRALWKTLKKLSKKSKKPRIYLLLDIAVCGIKYGAGYNDYQLCAFYRLNKQERKTYITRGVNQRLVQKLNDPVYFPLFRDKDKMCRHFGTYLYREWLPLPNTQSAVMEFLEKHDVVFYKPQEGSGGFGINRFCRDAFTSVSALADTISQKSPGILEEEIHQHSAIAALQPHSVNTVRITTLFWNDCVHIPYAYLRIGGGTNFVDNAHSGGMFAPIDLSTGIVSSDGYDKQECLYTVHPITGTAIKGFQIPFWKEILAFTHKLAHEVPQMRYIGWDIAVTENGPLLVEGNNYPGYDILQLPPHTPNRIGMLPQFQQILGEQI